MDPCIEDTATAHAAIMATGTEAEKADIKSDKAPKPGDIAAALEEARQNARLLRVSSSLFLREAKELIDADKVNYASY